MKTLLILGGGTAGTMAANKFAQSLDPHDWHIVVVDRDPQHYYQPGFLFIPFGLSTLNDVMRPKCHFLPHGVELIFSYIEQIEPEMNRVWLPRGRALYYDELVIATGTVLAPEETPGLKDAGWRKNIFDFYTPDGAEVLGAMEFMELSESAQLLFV